MENIEFKKLLSISNLSKKEFADMFGISQTTVNGWGTSGKSFPYWVESWLTNYIELNNFKDAYINCDAALKKANDYIHDLEGESIGITKDTTSKEIILAEAINKTSNAKIINVSDLTPEAITNYVNDIKKMQEDIEKLKEATKDK